MEKRHFFDYINILPTSGATPQAVRDAMAHAKEISRRTQTPVLMNVQRPLPVGELVMIVAIKNRANGEHRPMWFFMPDWSNKSDT